MLKNFSVRDNEKFQEAEKTLTWYNRRLFFKQLDDMVAAFDSGAADATDQARAMLDRSKTLQDDISQMVSTIGACLLMPDRLPSSSLNLHSILEKSKSNILQGTLFASLNSSIS